MSSTWARLQKRTGRTDVLTIEANLIRGISQRPVVVPNKARNGSANNLISKKKFLQVETHAELHPGAAPEHKPENAH